MNEKSKKFHVSEAYKKLSSAEKRAASTFTAWVAFKDGNCRHFHSNDNAASRTLAAIGGYILDRRLGFIRLKKMLEITFKNKYTTAIVVFNGTDELVLKMVDGEVRYSMEMHFFGQEVTFIFDEKHPEYVEWHLAKESRQESLDKYLLSRL